MNGRFPLARSVQVAATALLSGLLLVAWPAVWLAPVGRLAASLTPRLNPWIAHPSVRPDRFQLAIAGEIHLGMTLADGTALPALPGAWRKPGGQTLMVGWIALVAWSMIPAGRRRWLALPMTLFAAALAAAFVLSIEIQQSALRVLGYEWLPQHLFADTPGNHAAFVRLERAFGINRWIQSFHDAGGRLFYGLLAGWMLLALPSRPRRPQRAETAGQPGPQDQLYSQVNDYTPMTLN